jgi:hypothetical protein
MRYSNSFTHGPNRIGILSITICIVDHHHIPYRTVYCKVSKYLVEHSTFRNKVFHNHSKFSSLEYWRWSISNQSMESTSNLGWKYGQRSLLKSHILTFGWKQSWENFILFKNGLLMSKSCFENCTKGDDKIWEQGLSGSSVVRSVSYMKWRVNKRVYRSES